ncbi:hypothetical protein N9Y92_00340 [Chlamydiales bacterium]|nr:hypothetical protein [Chlamydiales bacterium]
MSFLPKVDVKDADEKKIGFVKQCFDPFSGSYILYSPEGDRLAQGDTNFLRTSFTFFDESTGKMIAYLTRPFFRLRTSWSISVKNEESFQKIYPLFVITLAMQTDLVRRAQRNPNQNGK